MAEPTTASPEQLPARPEDRGPIDDSRFAMPKHASSREISRPNEKGAQGVSLHIVGQAAKDAGKKKIPQIFVNCNVGGKDDKKFACLALHVVPLVRRLHEAYGGVVEIITKDFAPGIDQHRWMTDTEIADEYFRLAGKSSGDDVGPGYYMLPPRTKDDPWRNPFNDVYGTSKEGMLAFFKGLGELAFAWVALVDKCRADTRDPQPEEVWTILDLVDPRNPVSAIDIPNIPEIKSLRDDPRAARPAGSAGEQGAQGAAGGQQAPPPEEEPAADAELVAFLQEKKVPRDLATRFAVEVERAKGHMPLPEDAWKRAFGDERANKAARTALENHLTAFLTRTGATA